MPFAQRLALGFRMRGPEAAMGAMAEAVAVAEAAAAVLSSGFGCKERESRRGSELPYLRGRASRWGGPARVGRAALARQSAALE